MNKKLLSVFRELELKRHALFDILDIIEEDILRYKPNAASWSILHICYHLILSEELSLMYLNKKLQDTSTIAPAGIGSSIRSFYLNLALRLPFRLKAPQRVSTFPERLDWIELKKRWIKVRKVMNKRLSNIPEAVTKKLVYKHPSIGRLTLYQMLTFFRTHINRHEIQISRLILAGKNTKRS